MRSGGLPLDANARSVFESRFGRDFSHVRVHTGSDADAAARAVHARAYTVGRDIVFASGKYQPATSAGMRLLAHELTHTIQQGSLTATVPGSVRVGDAGSVQEKEADAAAARLGGEVHSEAAGASLQRDPEEGAGEAQDEKPQLIAGSDKAEPQKDDKKESFGCGRKIFAEGTCSYLVGHSKYICCDPDNGVERKGRTTDIEENDCPSSKFTPIFTCDNNCKTALQKGCSDNDNWMAVPSNQFTKKQCGDVWTICANGKQTTAYVRDHSVTDVRFEVSPKVQKDLGVKVGDSFLGSVYKPGAKTDAIAKDKCCTGAAPKKP